MEDLEGKHGHAVLPVFEIFEGRRKYVQVLFDEALLGNWSRVFIQGKVF